MANYAIKQISIFLENKPGRMAKVAEAMNEAKINILAFSIAEAGDFGVVRMLVNKPDEACKKLHEKGFTVSLTRVLGIKMKDEPGGLYEIAKILGDSDVNIDYAYAYSGTSGAVFILRVSDLELAIEKITEREVELIEDTLFE